jgi:hypothetical protein
MSARAQYAGYTGYGTKWLKALYRGYTDSTFTKYSDQPAFQGTQGPTIRAEVGDLIEILFINRLRKNYATMHSMGLAYTKTNEGSNYPNNTMPSEPVHLPLSDRVPPAVTPGDCVVYKWVVNTPAGPPEGTPAKVHSANGPSFTALIICRYIPIIRLFRCRKTQMPDLSAPQSYMHQAK